MSESEYNCIELLPQQEPPRQLFVLLHGFGAGGRDLLPLARRLHAAFPQAAIVLPEGPLPFDGGGEGRQWYSNRGVTDADRPARVAEAMPHVLALVRYARQRHGIAPEATALAGFSQGAIMALELCAACDGEVGRVLAFAGRFAGLPERAPRQVTIHLLHGEDDERISVQHAVAAEARLAAVNGDVTLDVLPATGHVISAAMAERAIYRLQSCIPRHLWEQAMHSL